MIDHEEDFQNTSLAETHGVLQNHTTEWWRQAQDANHQHWKVNAFI